jgi:hypothetical protein
MSWSERYDTRNCEGFDDGMRRASVESMTNTLTETYSYDVSLTPNTPSIVQGGVGLEATTREQALETARAEVSEHIGRGLYIELRDASGVVVATARS